MQPAFSKRMKPVFFIPANQQVFNLPEISTFEAAILIHQ